jgi:hypothetical protein
MASAQLLKRQGGQAMDDTFDLIGLYLYFEEARAANASNHLPAGSAAMAICWVHNPDMRGRCIASLGCLC